MATTRYLTRESALRAAERMLTKQNPRWGLRLRMRIQKLVRTRNPHRVLRGGGRPRVVRRAPRRARAPGSSEPDLADLEPARPVGVSG